MQVALIDSKSEVRIQNESAQGFKTDAGPRDSLAHVFFNLKRRLESTDWHSKNTTLQICTSDRERRKYKYNDTLHLELAPK